MNHDGWEAIKQALVVFNRANIDVKPEPSADEDLQFVNVVADKNAALPAEVINQLGRSGLLGNTSAGNLPVLRLVGQSYMVGSTYGSAGTAGAHILTFEDVNHR